MSDVTTIDGVNYGPLAALIGVWQGDKGVDRAPEPDGEERNPYYETLIFEAAGDVTNAEEQTLAVVHYKQVVSRKSNDEVFHHQVGYWLWDSADDTLVETFTIPRAVAVVAGGKLAQPENLDTELVFDVAADAASPEFGIVQAPFMYNKAKTTAFTHTITVNGDDMRYSETTVLDIYGKANYDHKDVNTLKRTG
ncbi:MAG: heme-binding beta-barrel domain-containing protein [Halioglobus sp.]